MQETKEKINLDEVVKILVKKYGPIKKIFLFGSQAAAMLANTTTSILSLLKTPKKDSLPT